MSIERVRAAARPRPGIRASRAQVARCVACDETLCARCFVLTHPPRPGGNEHDHLRLGKVRALCREDCTGAPFGLRAGTVGHGRPTRLCHDVHGFTSELTEDDLEARGCDLGEPAAIEAPKINYCVGDVDADPRGAELDFRQGEVVLVVSTEATREDASSDEDEPELRKLVARGPKLFRRRRERWGLVMDAPARTFVDDSSKPKKRGRFRGPEAPVRKPPSVRGDGGTNLYRVRVCGSASGDYRLECSLANDERTGHAANSDDAFRTRTGFVTAARLGFIVAQHRKFRAPPPLELNDASRVELVRAEHLERPESRRRVLEEARRVACCTVLAGVDLRVCRDVLRAATAVWHRSAVMLRKAERRRAATMIASTWKTMRRRRMMEALEQEAVDVAYEQTRQVHQQFRYVTDPEKFSTAYTTNGVVYFETMEELALYAKVLREKCVVVCQRLVERAAEIKKTTLRKWHQTAEFLRARDAVGQTHVEPLTEAERRALAASVIADAERKATEAPWHPAVGVDLPPLPALGCEREPGGPGHVITDPVAYPTASKKSPSPLRPLAASSGAGRGGAAGRHVDIPRDRLIFAALTWHHLDGRDAETESRRRRGGDADLSEETESRPRRGSIRGDGVAAATRISQRRRLVLLLAGTTRCARRCAGRPR